MKKKLQILSFCIQKIPSAIIGVIKPLEQLKYWNEINFNHLDSKLVTEAHIKEADVVICIRGAEKIDLNIVKMSRKLGKYVIYYLDDDLLNIHSSVYTNNREYFEDECVKNNIRAIMKESHCLWTVNKNIASKYNDLFQKVIKTDVPAILLQHNSDSNRGDKLDEKQIIIGFAGGIDHRDFFERMLLNPISFIVNKYKDKVRIEIFGFKPYIMHYLPLHYIPYRIDYNEYLKIMKTRQWDIGLAPIENTNFHSCKYFNKFLEYGAIKTAGIYSDSAPYSYIVKNHENGLLVQNTVDEWINGIEYLINNEEARQNIVSNSYKLLYNHFRIESIAREIIIKIKRLIQ